MKNYLLIAIMIALQSGKRYKAKELADKFESSIKSIYRTIDILLAAGMPICSIPGKNGGYEIIKESSISSSFFTMEELSSFISFIKSNPTNNINKIKIDDRLSSMKDKKLISHIQNKSQEIVIDTLMWGHSNKNNNLAEQFQTAICNKQKLLINYTDSKNINSSSRIVHPYSLVYKTDSWYIYAFCETRKSFRLFKLSRILSFKVLNEYYSPLNIDVLSKPWNKDFNKNMEEIDIELVCNKTYLSEMKNWLGDDIDINSLIGNKISLKGKAHFSIGLVHKIMEYGNKIKILKPEKLKNLLCSECKEIYNLYNEKNAI